MDTGRECLCCEEVTSVAEKMSEVEHPGFTTVCLDIWVLQTAYYQYRQHYGTHGAHTSIQE